MIRPKRGSRFLAALLSAGLALPAQALKIEVIPQSRVAALGGQADKPLRVVAEEVLVRFEPSASAGQRTAALGAVNGVILQELPLGGWTVVGLPPGNSVAPALSTLRAMSGVLGAEPNYAYRPVRLPNDPLALNQYHLAKVNAFAGWDYEVGSSSRVTVAVIDAGIQGNHPDLQSKLTGLTHQVCADVCASEAGGTATYACNHGTRVAGVAAAATDNAASVAGMSWGAKLLSLRVFTTAECSADCSDNITTCETSDTRIINAINHAITLQNSAAAGRIVINISLGQEITCAAAPLQTAIDAAFNAGIPVVVAAGNSGPGSGTVNKPGNCNNVLPVGATDSNDNVANFSSRGPELAANGVVAPGVNLLTTDINSATTNAATGTSFASPLVAGLAALMLSAKPNFTVTEVYSKLRASTEGIGVSALSGEGARTSGNNSGSGRVNAFRAMRLTVTGTLGGFDGDEKAIAFPNPFKPSTHGTATITIPTSLQSRNADIRIYTMDGQIVRKLTNQVWDGKNESGNTVATGTYIFTLKTDAGETRGRIAVIR